jgi:hypothetical protein
VQEQTQELQDQVQPAAVVAAAARTLAAYPALAEVESYM